MGVKRRLGEKPVEDTAETGKMTHRDGCLRLVDIFRTEYGSVSLQLFSRGRLLFFILNTELYPEHPGVKYVLYSYYSPVSALQHAIPRHRRHRLGPVDLIIWESTPAGIKLPQTEG